MTDIRTLIKSRKVAERIQAAQRLLRYEGDDRDELLLIALNDKNNYIAALAAEGLRSTTDLTTAKAMLDKFEQLLPLGAEGDAGCHIRAHLAYGFGKMCYYPADDALRKGIQIVQVEAVGGVRFDTAAYLRANCALGLAATQARDAVRDISILLFDMKGFEIPSENDALVRIEARKTAVEALIRLGDRAGLIPLSIKLVCPGREQPEVLQECMRGIVELEDDRALAWIEPYLEYADPMLAGYAALMIARTQHPKATGILMRSLYKMTGEALKATVLAIRTIRSTDAEKALMLLSSDSRESVRLAVIDAWDGTNDHAAQVQLRQMASEDPSNQVRDAAIRTLAAL